MIDRVEMYRQKRKEDYLSKFGDADIQSTIHEAQNKYYRGEGLHNGVDPATIALAMMSYNEMIDRRWADFDGKNHVYDYPMVEVTS